MRISTGTDGVVDLALDSLSRLQEQISAQFKVCDAAVARLSEAAPDAAQDQVDRLSRLLEVRETTAKLLLREIDHTELIARSLVDTTVDVAALPADVQADLATARKADEVARAALSDTISRVAAQDRYSVEAEQARGDKAAGAFAIVRAKAAHARHRVVELEPAQRARDKFIANGAERFSADVLERVLREKFDPSVEKAQRRAEMLSGIVTKRIDAHRAKWHRKHVEAA